MLAMQIDRQHCKQNFAIMDSGNNKRHSFRSKEYFPRGFRMHELPIMGVHGVEKVQVGIGVASFVTVCSDGSEKVWNVPGSIYNPESPVNLLCSDKFHYGGGCVDTGHEWRQKQETLSLSDGRTVRVPRDPSSHLPLLQLKFASAEQVQFSEEEEKEIVEQWCHNVCDTPTQQMFVHTHLQPHTTSSVHKILNGPLERRFNETIKHGLIDGVDKISPIRSINRADRPDSWFEGKMTQRSVAKKSRRPEGVELWPMSHT